MGAIMGSAAIQKLRVLLLVFFFVQTMRLLLGMWNNMFLLFFLSEEVGEG